MSAAGLSASGTSSATVYIPGPSSRRKSSVAAINPIVVNRDRQYKFYIPGETPTGGQFPATKVVPAANNEGAGDGGARQQSVNTTTRLWQYVYGKVLGVIQNTFKKGASKILLQKSVNPPSLFVASSLLPMSNRYPSSLKQERFCLI